MKSILALTVLLAAGAINLAATHQADAGPSYDCRKAVTADELTICASPTLSAGDILTNTAFYQAKRNNRQGALAIARQHLRERRRCAYDAACIQHSQLGALLGYQLFGATVLQRPGDY